jgi:hypothetical protein
MNQCSGRYKALLFYRYLGTNNGDCTGVTNASGTQTRVSKTENELQAEAKTNIVYSCVHSDAMRHVAAKSRKVMCKERSCKTYRVANANKLLNINLTLGQRNRSWGNLLLDDGCGRNGLALRGTCHYGSVLWWSRLIR